MRLKAWARPDWLIIDDVGLGQVRQRDDEPTAAHTLFNLIDRRHGKLSTAVTSNIDLRQWGKYLGDATVAAAILDRLAMHAIRIDIDGPSYRQHVAAERAASRHPKRPRPHREAHAQARARRGAGAGTAHGARPRRRTGARGDHPPRARTRRRQRRAPRRAHDLIDDFHRPRAQGHVVFLAHLICKREAALRHTLRRYRRAVRDALTPAPPKPDPTTRCSEPCGPSSRLPRSDRMLYATHGQDRTQRPVSLRQRQQVQAVLLLAVAPPTPTAAPVLSTADPIVDDDYCDCCIDRLTDDADRAFELLLDGDLDEAERICLQLMREFPREAEGQSSSPWSTRTADNFGAPPSSNARRSTRARKPSRRAETRLVMHQRLKRLEQA